MYIYFNKGTASEIERTVSPENRFNCGVSDIKPLQILPILPKAASAAMTEFQKASCSGMNGIMKSAGVVNFWQIVLLYLQCLS
jgi:hypothetical protein